MTCGAMGRIDGKPSHGYYTRSCANPESPKQQRHSFDEQRLDRRAAPKQMPSRQSQPPHDPRSRTETNDSESMQNSDPTQSDTMMSDVVSFAPIRAPFPSPAMKSTQPFSHTSSQQAAGVYGPSEATWGQQEQSWQRGGVPTGTCILVEAANRAQMAILVDDMGCMTIDQSDQK